MFLEVERKFLIKNDFPIPKNSGAFIRQGYIDTDNGLVRIRIINRKGIIGVKSKRKNLSRLEFEYEIPLDDAENIMSKICEDRVVVKTRYKIPYSGNIWDVDIYHGKNDGLKTAEVELKSEKQKINFPWWIGKEISFNKKYHNFSLAMKKNSSKGKLIVFEGICGSGKSTLLKEFSYDLNRLGYEVFLYKWNSNRVIRKLTKKIMESKRKLSRIYQILQWIGFFTDYFTIIKPAIKAGKIVLADRYYYTCLVRDKVNIKHRASGLILKLLSKVFISPLGIVYTKTGVRNCINNINSRGKKLYFPNIKKLKNSDKKLVQKEYLATMDNEYDMVLINESKSLKVFKWDMALDSKYELFSKVLWQCFNKNYIYDDSKELLRTGSKR